MIRICYHCNEPIETLEDAVMAQKLEDILATYTEFEGWVHCRGEPEEFIQEDDTELLEALGRGTNNYVGGILLHTKCVVTEAIKELWPPTLDEDELEPVIFFH